MDQIEALTLALGGFRERLVTVGDDQRFLPTPCADWNVAELVSHVIGGNHMTVRLLQGAERPEATGYLAGLPLGEDPVATYDEGAAQLLAAVDEAGALQRNCEHPIGDMPGEMLLGFRVGDLLTHTWDLAVAIDGDADLHPDLVQVVWDGAQPLRGSLVLSGVFGEGPSGHVRDDAPLQDRLLDLFGRRP